MEGDTFVTVHVSTELLAELREWSAPVQAQIVDTPGHSPGYQMIFRTHQCRSLEHGQMTATDGQADAVLAFARNTMGLRLDPWQERTIRAIYAGQIESRSRRNGLRTIKRVIAEHEEMRGDSVADQTLVDQAVAAIGTMDTLIPSLSTFQAEAIVRAVWSVSRRGDAQ